MFLSRYCAEIMCCGRTVWKNGYNFEVKLPLQFSYVNLLCIAESSACR